MENEIIESAYPARGNVLIVMGADGRERALAYARAVGFDGRWHDEATYKKSLETRREFHWKFFTKYSRDLKSLDLTVPDDVRLLNEFCGEMGFGDEQKEAFFSDLACTTENPQNVVFAADLKDMRAPYRIKELCDTFQLRSIHVAWALDGCTENDRMRILEFSRSMTEPEYSDDGTPIWSWSLNGDVWFIIPKDDGECEKFRIKESGQPIPDDEALASMGISFRDSNNEPRRTTMKDNNTTVNSSAEPYDAGAEIVKMLIEHPERADELEEEDWQELDGDQWADLIEARPAFRSKGPWELSSWDWGRFFARLPDRLEAYPAFKESDEPSFWASFLAGQPQFAEKCPWDKLKGRDWAMLLCEQPQFADRCAWDKLEGYDWALLLEDQPQFADRCSWDKLDKCAWRRLLSAQPQFAEKCPFQEVLRQK